MEKRKPGRPMVSRNTSRRRDMLAGCQQETNAQLDRKLEEARKAVRLGEIEVSEISLDLEPMVLGRGPIGLPSWVERMAGLRDRLGPFRLAFLESLIVASDVRASRDPQGDGNARASTRG